MSLSPSKEAICDGFEEIRNSRLKKQQEPWRLPSRQAEFNATDRLGIDAHSDYQAVTKNQGYFEKRELKLN